MNKQKTHFVCQECGATYPRHQGQCYHCNSWNTIVEEIIEKVSPLPESGIRAEIGEVIPMPLANIEFRETEKLRTGIPEFDRVTGGGIVPGSLMLIGGSPGIGKSTLLLLAANQVSLNYTGKVLYVTGEESPGQIKMRALRLGVKSDNLLILSEIDMGKIILHIKELSPILVVIDSIQTMLHPSIESSAGSVSQVRESAGIFQRLSKSSGIPVILVGHITKSGAIAGPMIMEHIVDAVLYFEGETLRDFRILRALKNRFGSTREIGVFAMESGGLRCIENPSEFFVSHRKTDISNSIVTPVLEGSRTLLIEIQALVIQSGFGMPARRAEGVSANRLTLLLAVMEKRARMQLGGCDVFVNIAGGIQVEEPAVDLGIVIAVASSLRDRPVPSETCAVGEVGLGGEIRGVSRIDERVREVARMGFKRIILPAANIGETLLSSGVQPVGVDTISQALEETWNSASKTQK